MWTIFEVFVEFVTTLLLFLFWLFGHKACGILVPQPGIEPPPPDWKAESLPLNCQGSPVK